MVDEAVEFRAWWGYRNFARDDVPACATDLLTGGYMCAIQETGLAANFSFHAFW